MEEQSFLYPRFSLAVKRCFVIKDIGEGLCVYKHVFTFNLNAVMSSGYLYFCQGDKSTGNVPKAVFD